MAIRTVSRMGRFSSDRSIAEYCEQVWRVGPAPVPLRYDHMPRQGVVFPWPGKPSET